MLLVGLLLVWTISTSLGGNVKSLPLVGEVVTVAEGAGKAVAAGACAVVGQTQAAKELIDGAGNAFVEYSEKNCIAANVNMLAAHCAGEQEKVERLKTKQAEAWLDLAENTPVVGHGIGIGRYIAGDTEGGDRCMIGATRSAAVGTAIVLTGGAGAVACGAAAVGSGIVYDGVATGANSAAKGKFAPTGNIAGVANAVKTGNANDIFDCSAAPVVEFASGALHGAAKANAKGRVAKAQMENITPAEQLAQRPRAPSFVERYQSHGEVPNAGPQVPFENIRNNPSTAGFIREFASPQEAMAHLEKGTRYDFVRTSDGKIRAISHPDAAKAVQRLQSDCPVGHTSLVEPGTRVVAAGEIHVNMNGVIENINCQSGHFRVPLKLMKQQIGKAFPRTKLTFTSPTFSLMLDRMGKIPAFADRLNAIIPYTPLIFAIGAQSVRPLVASPFVVAWHSGDQVEIIACTDREFANNAFDSIGDEFAKVLMNRPSNSIARQHGLDQPLQHCINAVKSLNQVMPEGSWTNTCRNAESWSDAASDFYVVQTECKNFEGEWIGNQLSFKPGQRAWNDNGDLKLH